MAATKVKNDKPSNEEIYAIFQTLRNEQRVLAGKLSEMESELNEHKVVIDTLNKVDGDRRCYRMVGGVLCERTVKEVLPSLANNKEQLTKLIETLNKQLSDKGTEINEFKKKHSIRVHGNEDVKSNQQSDEPESTKKSALSTIS
ncbi:prefoldin subunit 2 [Trichogramma pretiosum]|uniref:prefoldin subunit 2 n=1 Tax=Trichogramma pretiosum TaxID=7493 RepID=UPI0006C97118|nr:prefoldin subunit 2 [Trichogramma pretiosum]